MILICEFFSLHTLILLYSDSFFFKFSQNDFIFSSNSVTSPLFSPSAIQTLQNTVVLFLRYEEFIPIPPDGGWGWMVVAAAFVCNMIVGGVTYAFGVLQVHLAGYFLVAKSKVLLIGSMQCGMILFVGKLNDICMEFHVQLKCVMR